MNSTVYAILNFSNLPKNGLNYNGFQFKPYGSLPKDTLKETYLKLIQQDPRHKINQNAQGFEAFFEKQTKLFDEWNQICLVTKNYDLNADESLEKFKKELYEILPFLSILVGGGFEYIVGSAAQNEKTPYTPNERFIQLKKIIAEILEALSKVSEGIAKIAKEESRLWAPEVSFGLEEEDYSYKRTLNYMQKIKITGEPVLSNINDLPEILNSIQPASGLKESVVLASKWLWQSKLITKGKTWDHKRAEWVKKNEPFINLETQYLHMWIALELIYKNEKILSIIDRERDNEETKKFFNNLKQTSGRKIYSSADLQRFIIFIKQYLHQKIMTKGYNLQEYVDLYEIRNDLIHQGKIQEISKEDLKNINGDVQKDPFSQGLEELQSLVTLIIFTLSLPRDKLKKLNYNYFKGPANAILLAED